MSIIKVVVLGAPGVGKTSIVQQFVWNEFSDVHRPTTEKHSYLASILCNEKSYALQITDLPVIPYFPADSLFEWADYRYYGLRSATAYILVFDVNLPETFQYVKNMREQILQSRAKEVPILVVGNKHDLEPREHREVAGLVKKHWRCGYVECSAKYNWHVVALFRDLARTIEGHRPDTSAGKSRDHHEHGDKKCAIS